MSGLVNMDRGKINIAVFLDLQKAFDTINHDILLKKLERYGMGSPVLNLLRNYLTDRTWLLSIFVLNFPSAAALRATLLETLLANWLFLFLAQTT